MLSITYSACTVAIPAVMWMTQEKVSHKDVMNSYKTKKDVIKNFGVPTTKAIEEDIEIWVYEKGSNNSNKIIESDIEFQFEDGEHVSSWRTEEYTNYGNTTDRVKKAYIGYYIGGIIDLIIVVLIIGSGGA